MFFNNSVYTPPSLTLSTGFAKASVFAKAMPGPDGPEGKGEGT